MYKKSEVYRSLTVRVAVAIFASLGFQDLRAQPNQQELANPQELGHPLIHPVRTQSTELDELVVTANKVETPRERLGQSVTVITAKEIEKSHQRTVAGMLRRVPGLDVVSSGGPGTVTSVFIRGANSEHTLVLIDGVEVNNVISNNRSFNFGNLSLLNVERIEIVRGPQGSIYGSDALGGVINIITKQGGGDPSTVATTNEGSPTAKAPPTNSTVTAEGGSYGTTEGSASVRGGDSKLKYSLAGSGGRTGGISAANTSRGATEQDGYEHGNFSGRVGGTLAKDWTVDLSVNGYNARTDIDNGGGANADDPNRLFTNQALFLQGKTTLDTFDGALATTIGAALNDQEFQDNNDPDPQHPLDRLRSKFQGRFTKFYLQNVIRPVQQVTLLVGAEAERENGDSTYFSDGSFGLFEDNFPSKHVRTNGYYTNAQVEVLEDFYTSFGGRIDDNQRFGSQGTWSASSSYVVRSTDSRILGNIGTAYKAPSLYQLYSSFGSLDLQPEKNLGWSAGVEQFFLEKRYSLSAQYFSNEFKQLVSFDPGTFIFTNIARAKSSGVELEAKGDLVDWATASLSYTYDDATDIGAGTSLLRRPRHKLRSQVDVDLAEGFQVSLGARLAGKRYDLDFSDGTAQRVALASYTLWDLSATYDLSRTTKLYGRVDNLFDKEYEDVFGFGTPGASAIGGVQLSF